MATTYKILGQSIPSSASISTLYTVPTSSQAVISSITVCNQSTSTTYRVAVVPSGSVLGAKNYICYEAPLNANDSIFLSLGLSLSGSDSISVLSGNSSASFNVYGAEIG